MKRRFAILALLTSGIAPAVVLAFATPSEAGAVFGGYSVTAVVRGSATDGDIGASGGLTPLDSGSASVDAAIDNNPSASALARPVEPGTTYTTVGSQVPLDSGYPRAEASFPGGPKESSVAPTDYSAATAKVSAHSAFGEAHTAASSLEPFTIGASSATAALTASPGGITASGTSSVSSFTIAGLLEVRNVKGQASITATPGGRSTVTATLDAGRITVAGQEVTVDADGVHAEGLPDSPLTPRQVTDQVDAVLRQAGVSLSLGTAVKQDAKDGSGHHAAADTGGLIITVTTPDPSDGAIPGNTVTFILGRVLLLESDSPPVTAPPTDDDSAAPPATDAPSSDVVPDGPPLDVTPPEDLPPEVAPDTGSVDSPGTQLVLAGQTFSKPAALIVVGAWMAMSMSMALFAAMGTRPQTEELLP